MGRDDIEKDRENVNVHFRRIFDMVEEVVVSGNGKVSPWNRIPILFYLNYTNKSLKKI